MTKTQKAKVRLLNKVLHAVKQKCKEDCCNGDRKSWIDCSLEACPLHQYRLGNSQITS